MIFFVSEWQDFLSISCRKCGTEVGPLWNRRPIEDAQDKEIARLREALEVILDAAQKDEPCVLAIKAVAYTALKGKEE